jgi:hypothetical protein
MAVPELGVARGSTRPLNPRLARLYRRCKSRLPFEFKKTLRPADRPRYPQRLPGQACILKLCAYVC